MTTTTPPRHEQSTGPVEICSIDYVPLSERGGEPWHLGPVWFQANAQHSTLAAGLMGVSLDLLRDVGARLSEDELDPVPGALVKPRPRP